MKTVQKIDLLGRREAATLATATTQRVFASVGAPMPPSRQAVSLANCDASAELYATLAPTGTTPAPTASDHDFTLSPRTSRTVWIGAGIEIWVRTASTGSVTYTAVELL